jgi:cytochrome c oxidase subunit 2
MLCIAAPGQQRVVVVHAKRFAFSPASITVKAGQAVTLSLISDDVAHSLMIEGLHVNAVIAPDHPTAVQIKAIPRVIFPAAADGSAAVDTPK